ncbi:SRPBCC domain-containing protein [Candidatus Obscuribacterales bacterium]|nr:SRPBCC domain-containing protein [Candidatus Obscuribacterales bacterium]MBX3150917.1 SRPBCC domain-containing protein [Candidatus Obscuribacterales bacterium]
MTTTCKVQPTVLEITKVLKAPVERVYKTWTEPEHMAKWFGCAKTGTVQIEQDLRVGGNFRVEMHCTDGEIAIVHGTFKEIEPNKKLVYTWTNNSQEFPAEDTLVTVLFMGNGKETELRLKHQNFAKEISAQGHSMGWGASLDKFESLFSDDAA